MLRLLATLLLIATLTQPAPQVDVAITAWQEPEHTPDLSVVSPGRTFPYQVAVTADEADAEAAFFEFDFRDPRLRASTAVYHGLCTHIPPDSTTQDDRFFHCGYDAFWKVDVRGVHVFWVTVLNCGDGSPIVVTARTNSDTATYSLECHDARVYLPLIAR